MHTAHFKPTLKPKITAADMCLVINGAVPIRTVFLKALLVTISTSHLASITDWKYSTFGFQLASAVGQHIGDGSADIAEIARAAAEEIVRRDGSN